MQYQVINKCILVLALCLLVLGNVYAQRENVWAFGYHAGVDFNGAAPVPITTSMATTEACASVCSATGQLLFYTNGERVWDQNGNFMQNGITIATQQISSTTQGATIVLMPDSPSKYYIFSLSSIENGPGGWGKLYYTVVDMSMNNGLGAVDASRTGVLVDTGLQENMTAVAGRDCNVWLLTITQKGVLKAFSIDHNGVNTVAVQSPVIPGSGIQAVPIPGSIAVSPDRTKVAIADSAVTLYDFNAATGTVSNPLVLATQSFHYAVCFSANSSKLYATRLGIDGVKQFDLSSGIPSVIAGSLVLLNPGFPSPCALKRGPDDKIYCFPNNFTLGVINQPNLAGTACNYTPGSFQLAPLTNGRLGSPGAVAYVIPTGDTVFDTHVINVTDCFTDSYTLQVNTQAVGLVWEDGSTLPVRTVIGPGTYWSTYSFHCVVYSDTFVVHFPNALPIISVYPACKGQNSGLATASPNNAGYVYTWRNTAATIVSTSDSLKHAVAGAYTLRVVTPDGCDSTFSVFIPEEQHIASFEVDTIICQGASVGFNNTSDNHFTQFAWTFGDGNVSAQQSPTHTYSDKGYYSARLIATDPVCIDTAIRHIAVDSILSSYFNLDPDRICIGQYINFYPYADSTVQSFHWSYGDGTSMTSEPEPLLHHAYDTDGTMAVNLSTEYRACPTSSFADTVWVYPLPKIYLGPDSGLCLDGAPIALVNEWNDPGTPTKNLWNTGDTTASLKVVHPGTYSLTISNGPLGCSATGSVVIHKNCYVDIPNAFTPNGDGENDYFFPRQLLSRNITRFEMRIMNRWGQEIFTTTRTDGRGWDGRLNDKPQQQGVYIYLINLTVDNRREEQYTGNVTLIR